MLKPILFLSCAALILFARYGWELHELRKDNLHTYIGRSLEIVALVQRSSPGDSLDSIFILKVLRVCEQVRCNQVRGMLRVRIREEIFLSSGDQIKIKGTLTAPFSRDPRVSASLSHASIVSVVPSSHRLVRLLGGLKSFISMRLQRILPEPAAGLALGMLMGDRVSLSEEILQDFRRTGMSHVLALSGFNILILINCISALPLPLPWKWRDISTMCIVILFVTMVGFSASVVRAAVMGCLGLFAHMCGRRSASLRSLYITAYGMALLDPFIIVYDIGFQLSCAATAGIILYAKRATQWVSDLFRIEHSAAPICIGVAEMLGTTLSAYMFTMPLVLFHFGGFSLVAPIANVILAPLVPLIMFASFVSLVLGPIAAPFTWLLCRLFVFIAHLFATVPLAFIDVGTS